MYAARRSKVVECRVSVQLPGHPHLVMILDDADEMEQLVVTPIRHTKKTAAKKYVALGHDWMEYGDGSTTYYSLFLPIVKMKNENGEFLEADLEACFNRYLELVERARSVLGP